MSKESSKSFVMAVRLRSLREEKNLTYEKLHDLILEKYAINISVDSLKNYEVATEYHKKSGKNEGMSVKFLRCLADFYGVSADYLLGRTDMPSPDVNIQSVTLYTGMSESISRWFHSLDRSTVSDMCSIMDQPMFSLLMFELINVGIAIKAERIYDKILRSFLDEISALDEISEEKEDKALSNFETEIRRIIDSQQYDTNVNSILKTLLFLESDQSSNPELYNLIRDGFRPSEFCANRANRYFTELLGNVIDAADPFCRYWKWKQEK